MPGLGIGQWDDLVGAIQREIGADWQITGLPELIWAPFQPEKGGRADDAVRAGDLQGALADDGVRAIVALRGGAWLLRILERIDFSVVARRRKPVILIGFSEWTCLLLVAARYPAVVSIHHTSPMYMLSSDAGRALSGEQKQCRWREIWSNVRLLLEAKAPAHVLKGRLVTRTPLPTGPVQLYGGNLTLVTALAGTGYQDAVRPEGAWLAIEDVNESIGRVDRKVTQLRLAGLLEGLGGVLLGGFTSEGRDISGDVATLLGVHVPGSVPIVAECNFGHFWPAAPFPVRRPVRLVSGPEGAVEVDVDWPGLMV